MKIRGAYRRGSQLCRVGLGEIRVDRQNSISLAPRPHTALKIMQEALGDGEKNAQYAQLIHFIFLATMCVLCVVQVRNHAQVVLPPDCLLRHAPFRRTESLS
jgi:hypothetical protein